jgi:hypothetical protein
VVREISQKVKRTGSRFAAFLDDCELDPSWLRLTRTGLLRRMSISSVSVNGIAIRLVPVIYEGRLLLI